MRLAFLAVLLALAVPASALGAPSKVLADCNRHDGVVAGSYGVGALRAAYRRIPRDRRVAADCGQSIASHVAALRGRKGGREAGAVLDDCTRHGGRLTLRFAPHALNRAATRMTRARREQTRCLVGIYSQLRARERPVAVNRPGPSRVGGPYNDQTGEELYRSLARFTRSMREFAEPYDAIPPNVIALLERRNERGDGFSFFSVRRVGPGDTPVWLVTANGRMCAIRWYGDTIPPDLECIQANRWAKGQGVLTVRDHSDGSHDVWGVVPDAFEDGTLLFGNGRRTRPLVTRGNGVLDGFEQLPGAIEWSALGGKQWFDPTTVPCRVNCLSVPAVAGLR